MLDARRLRVLVEVAHRGSFSGAADALDYTPSAVSQQVAALEREVGTTLFDRGVRGAVLTDAGRALVSHGERIVAGLEAAEAEIQAIAGLRGGLLRFGWFASAGATLVPQAIAAFRARYPGIELSLDEAEPDDCAASLRARELELALVYEFELAGEVATDLRQVDLLEDRLYVALPRDHRLASRRRLALAELAEEAWIQGVRRGSSVEVLPVACRAAGFEPRIAFRTDDHMAVQGLVAAGVGVGLFPALALPTARSDIVLRRVSKPALIRHVRAALPPGVTVSPTAEEMITVLQEVATALVGEAATHISTVDAAA